MDNISVWNTGGMILTEDIRNFGRKTCRITTLSATNPTRFGLGKNMDTRDEKPATTLNLSVYSEFMSV
jgi:hypothetical protein